MIEALLAEIRKLPPDTKAERLVAELKDLRGAGYAQAMVFTQYTDTMDFLRMRLGREPDLRVMCFSGRGGEILEKDGTWRVVGREDAKRRFKQGKADVMLCTDAAAEGLNFQFCGALVNYDMPWNPMRVEQRIGRIDRLGQRYEIIRVANLHYADTVEADVYLALRKRINLFTAVVGKLQPILSRLPGVISQSVLTGRSAGPAAREAVVGQLERETAEALSGGFDLDTMIDADLAEPARPAPALTMNDLERVLSRTDLLPAGVTAMPMGPGEFSYVAAGMKTAVRTTTRAEYFDDHADSMELWSMGSPLFPHVDLPTVPENEFRTALNSTQHLF